MSSERKLPDDHELEDFLAGRHPLGKAYRDASGHETAPPELDAAILGAAREAVRTPRPRRPRWVQPLAVAATLALSLGVLLNLWRDPRTREQMAPTAGSELDRMKERAQQEAPASPDLARPKAEAASAAAPEPSREAAPEVKLGASKRAFEDGMERRSEQDARKPKSAAALENAAPAPVVAEPPRPEPSRRSLADAPAGASPGFVPEPPPASAAPAPPPPAREPLQPESQRTAPSGAGAVTGSRYDAAPAEAAKDRKQAQDALESMARQRAGGSRDEDAGAATRSAAPQSSAPAPSPSSAAEAMEREFSESADDAGATTAPPEDWIRKLRELRGRGDEAGARELLKRFREQYPDYGLPEDLRALETH